MCLFCDSNGQVQYEGQVLEGRQGPLDLFQPADPGYNHHPHPRDGCLVRSHGLIHVPSPSIGEPYFLLSLRIMLQPQYPGGMEYTPVQWCVWDPLS